MAQLESQPRFHVNLDTIRIASPCPANWDEMTGDDRSRFCGQCELNVYNLSDMTRNEAEGFLSEKEGRVCVRYHQREDGSIITKDCPVGLQIKHRKRLHFVRKGIAASIMLATIGGLFYVQKSYAKDQQPNTYPSPQQILGKPMPPGVAGGIMLPPSEINKFDKKEPKHIKGRPVIMGDIAVPPPPPSDPQIIPPQNSKDHQELRGEVIIPPTDEN